MKVEIELPKRVGVKDYHEFFRMEDNLRLVNRQFKVREFGFIGGGYVGMIYMGSLDEPENKLLIAEIKKEAIESLKTGVIR